MRNKDSKPDQKRRMHFNVLAHNQSSEWFEGILTKAQSATEKFENQKIESLRIWFYRNLWDRISFRLTEIIAFLSEYNNIITYFIAFIFLLLMGDTGSVISGEPLEVSKNIITYLLALIVLTNTLLKLSRKLKVYRRLKPFETVTKFLEGEETIKSLDRWIENQNKMQRAHPIMILMVSLFILEKVKTSRNKSENVKV